MLLDSSGGKWFEAKEIDFSVETIYFVLDNILIFKDGQYPVRPSTDYTHSESQCTGTNRNASFIGPAEIYAEVSRRVDACWPHFIFVYEKYEKGYSCERIARIHHQRVDDVERYIGSVIGYVASGQAPRWVTTAGRKGAEYKDWVGHRRPVGVRG